MIKEGLAKALSALNFPEIQRYLTARGWSRVDVPHRDDISVYQKEKNDSYYSIIIPLSTSFNDYLERMYDVVRTIAEEENRSERHVLTDLLINPSDIIRYKLDYKEVISGTIPLETSFSFLEAAKKTLFITACDLVQPEKYHKRLSLKGANQFIQRCRVGQTEHGSFVLPLICPFIEQTKDDEARQLSIFDQDHFETSFTRQVTKRFMWTMNEVSNAIKKDELNRVVDLQGTEMISANLIEAIIDLSSLSDNSASIVEASWSGFVREVPDVPRIIELTPRYLTALERIRDQIKPNEEEVVDTFIGKVSQCKAEADIHKRVEGEIQFNFMVDNDNISKAKVTLRNEDYIRANEAHLAGKTVSIKGRLISSGKSKVIEAEELKVI